MSRIEPYYKAVTGFIVPFLTTILASLLESSDGGTSITASEWISATLISLSTGGAVFKVPNKDSEGEHQEESVQPPEEEGYIGKQYDADGDGIPDGR